MANTRAGTSIDTSVADAERNPRDPFREFVSANGERYKTIKSQFVMTLLHVSRDARVARIRTRKSGLIERQQVVNRRFTESPAVREIIF